MTEDNKADERMIQVPASKLVGLLDDLGEVERRLEQIGIDQGEFYNLISANVSGLSTFLLDAGCGDLMGAVEVPPGTSTDDVLKILDDLSEKAADKYR